MQKYTEREAKVAIRSLNTAIEEVLSAKYISYKSKINEFIALSDSNPIIKAMIEPFKKIEIDFDAIHYSYNGFRIDEMRLPVNSDERIAYIIQIFDKASKGKIPLEKLAYSMYHHKRFEDNIQDFMYDIARPQLRELAYLLDDLLEDEIKGKEIIPETTFQIINHGSITASDGANIALGQHIQQTASNSIVNEITQEIDKLENLTPEEKEQLKQIANEIKNEIDTENPSRTKLGQFAHKVLEVGQTGALKVFNTIITDPRWGQAAADALIGLM